MHRPVRGRASASFLGRIRTHLFNVIAGGTLACSIMVPYTGVVIAQNVNQKSEGDCSPNIIGGGNVTVVCPEGESIRPRGPGDAEMIAAMDFINRGNMRLAAQFAEKALSIWSALPNRHDSFIKNKMAAAHSVVGLGLAVMGATARDRSIGCNRLLIARRLYVETGNSIRIAKTDDDMRFGGCNRRR